MAVEIEIVELFSWELWWQDCYHVLERSKKSRKGFPTAEDDGQSILRGECCPSGFFHA